VGEYDDATSGCFVEWLSLEDIWWIYGISDIYPLVVRNISWTKLSYKWDIGIIE
jgi:hypothetical protein